MIGKNRILAITLARSGSKSIPQKNIKKINNLPLIYYTIKEALKSKYIDNYIVSTDSNTIKRISEKYGANCPFLRPKKYSQDKSSSVSALKHAVERIEKKEKIKYDFVIELMCTNPLKNSFDIDECIKLLIKNKADSVIAMHQLEDHHPARIKKIIKGKIRDFCVKEINESRRQDLRPKAYIRSGSIYALKRDYLMKKNRRYGGNNSFAYILPNSRVINIDDKFDFLIAKNLLK